MASPCACPTRVFGDRALHEHRRPSSLPSPSTFLAQRRDRHAISAFCPISRTELRHIGRVFQIISQRRFEFPRAMAMNDAQKGRARHRRTIQRRNHVIQRLVRSLPSNIHDRLFIEPQPAAQREPVGTR